ncbi:hypothetical protein BOTBODRAFT_105598 [Botryobasidium botryosum FD-172 SS1]|uniref:Protein kinase domain-containing protein n=1 Tax=Botryobasidium botryosum (strain FD-172 SS1) TaxID=930990 RepID=A0A067MPQ7_BOTB1|nr:hypothetical protein BOTBODRAFT_105598 [Botryobasidium botryosum FD-172 SS1]
MREIKAWMNLRHPNILPFIGTFIEERAIYMVSPWMSNGSLPQYLKQNLRVNRLKLLQEIAEGLHYLHTLQPAVVHGDIKGDNILISDSGTACIADFGLSERLAQKSATENSNTWYTAGNPRWQAPELLNAVTYAEVRRTTQSDMFAFGRVVAGEKPFAAIENSSAIIPLVIKGLFPERPSGFGDRLWNLMKECCHLYPSNRPSAQYVVHRLRKPHGVRAGLLAAFRASTM